MQVLQEQKPVLVTFGIADMNAQSGCIYVTQLQIDPLTQTQAQAIEGKEEHTVAQLMRRKKQLVHLFGRQNIRNFSASRRLDHGNVKPGFSQHMGIEKLQAIQIQFHCTPGEAA